MCKTDVSEHFKCSDTLAEATKAIEELEAQAGNASKKLE